MKLESLMMRKIPLWVLMLLVVLVFVAFMLFGWAVKHALHGDERLGKTGEVVLAIADFPTLVKSTFSEIRRGDKSPLLVHNRFPLVDGFTKNGEIQQGAVTDEGFLLLSAYDPTKAQSTVKLIRINTGHVLHEWVPNIEKLESDQHTSSAFFNIADMRASDYRMIHPLLLNDESIVFKYRGPLFKLNACSEVAWSIDGLFHHSIEPGSEGNFWVSSVIEPALYDSNKFIGYRDDAIAQVSPNGKVLFTKSISKILEENGYRGLVFGAGLYDNDAIHLNDIQEAQYSTQYWNKGDLLLSLRNRSAIVLYRPSLNKVIWLKTGQWLNQHDVDFVGESKISIFGNDVIRTPIGASLIDSQNAIYLVDLADDTIFEPYADALKKSDVRTLHQGQQDILENGDLFIEETDYARILRLSGNRIVWEFTIKVDDSTLAMVNWSRYLTESQVKDILPVLQGKICSQK